MNRILIANWKMELTHDEARSWLSEHISTIDAALSEVQSTLVICPSFTDLTLGSSIVTKNIIWGAQDCSHEERAAITGDISALSLAQLGCKYVIIGHSDRRRLYGDTNERISRKALLALRHGLTPIICIGETEAERNTAKTYAVLESQLEYVPALSLLNKTFFIAYEPLWAIGTGKTPSQAEIAQIGTWIKTYILEKDTPSCKFLYGGSVSSATISTMPLNALDGFLIGKASTNANELERIILSLKKIILS